MPPKCSKRYKPSGFTRISLLPVIVASSLFGQPSVDGDGDGLDDSFEQAILHRFTPVFHIAESDCAVLPSEFRAGTSEPSPLAPNGVIYGQVFPRHFTSGEDPFLEVHFYHLWARDCGI